MMKKICLLMCVSLLSGCTILSQEEALPLYTLKSSQIEPSPVFHEPLAVEMPLSEASLNTERIALTPSPYEREYLAEGQWPDRLPKVIQEVLLESLSERWGAGSVSRLGGGIEVKYILQTEIQDFSVYHLNTPAPEVHLKIAFKVLNLRTRKVFTGQTFFVKEKICVVSMKGIVETLNKGLHSLLNEVMPWMENAFLKEQKFKSTVLK